MLSQHLPRAKGKAARQKTRATLPTLAKCPVPPCPQPQPRTPHSPPVLDYLRPSLILELRLLDAARGSIPPIPGDHSAGDST